MMSTSNSKPPEGGDLAAKMLSSARRLMTPPTEVLRSAEPAVSKSSVVPSSPAERASELSQPTERTPAASKPAQRRVREEGSRQVATEFEVDPGKATCTLSVRVPRKVRAELNLLAMQARYGGDSGPTTVNDLVLEAINKMLRVRRAEAA